MIYQYGDSDTDRLEMDYLEFIARVTAHIPHKGQMMIRYYDLYSFITKHAVIDKIVQHLGIKFACGRPPPAVRQEELY